MFFYLNLNVMEILSKLLACLLVCNMLFSLSCRDEIIPEKDSKKETPKVKLSNTEIKKEFWSCTG